MRNASLATALIAGIVGACANDEPGNLHLPDLSAAATDRLECAGELCTRPYGVTGELCCVDPFSGGCGVKGDSSCVAIPRADPTCLAPDLTGLDTAAADGGRGPFSRFFVQCCASDNQCGIDYGMGCTDLATLCTILPTYLAATLRPASCDGTPMPLPDNCGMDFDLPGLGGSGD